MKNKEARLRLRLGREGTPAQRNRELGTPAGQTSGLLDRFLRINYQMETKYRIVMRKICSLRLTHHIGIVGEMKGDANPNNDSKTEMGIK